MGDLDHPRLKPLGLPPVGRPAREHLVLTKTLLLVGQEGTTQRAEVADRSMAVPNFEVIDPTLRAYDKATGKVVGEVRLPRNPTAAPITYRLNGEQFIVVAIGGANLPAELIALRLM
jgi:hypothetical protein